ncbi:cobalt/nickel transport system ATP-binding protein [Selenomonas sp. GACV-9]|uniref:energy-coupling factor ABC transporter ATP-binding protein n=1 Tax=Selenomonas sp. GACV-9 TaxID=3158782 RepID=UPI0008DF9B73|nr:cobalt/nickel transport system ATP-binding protein [Selenomonas ruminantium]
MIHFDDVCYAYDGEPVLRHASFTIKKGETVVLRGPNGAGKSTLLRMLNGLIYPELGTYHFCDTKITADKMRDHCYSKWFHQQMGFVWQNPDAQLFCASVAEELAFGPEQMGLAPDEIACRVDDALELLGLARLRGRAPYTLSGGEKKKTAIASILTMNPSVWTFDEPLSALDEKAQAWLREFLQALKDAGKTLIIATHDASLSTLADRMLTIHADHSVELLS